MRISGYLGICLLMNISQIIGSSDGIPVMTHMLYDPLNCAQIATTDPAEKGRDISIVERFIPLSDTLQLRDTFLYIDPQESRAIFGRPIPPLLTGKQKYTVKCTAQATSYDPSRIIYEYTQPLPISRMRYFLLHADHYFDTTEGKWVDTQTVFNPRHLAQIQACTTLVHAHDYLEKACVPYPIAIVDLAAWLICCHGPDWHSKLSRTEQFIAHVPHQPLRHAEWHPCLQYILKELR